MVTQQQVVSALRQAEEKGYRQSRHYLVDPKDPKHTCALGVILQELYGWDGKVKGKLHKNDYGYQICEFTEDPWKKHHYMKDFEREFGGWTFSYYLQCLNDNDNEGTNYASDPISHMFMKWNGKLSFEQIADILEHRRIVS